MDSSGFQDICGKALTEVSQSLWQYWHKPPLVLPLYHAVVDGESSAHLRHLFPARTSCEFEEQLDWFLRHYETVSLDAVCAHVKGEKTLERPSFHITVDDGFRNAVEVIAPILERKGVAATFFIATAFLDRGGLPHRYKISIVLEWLRGKANGRERSEVAARLNCGLAMGEIESAMLALPYGKAELVEEIAAVAGIDFAEHVERERPYLDSHEVADLVTRGFTVGAHSCTHRIFRELTLEEQLQETRDSMELIATRFGCPVRAFAFPHNDQGVSEEYFRQAFGGGIVDITFGTNGLCRHWWNGNVERVVMEVPEPIAARVVRKEVGRAFRNDRRTRRSKLSSLERS